MVKRYKSLYLPALTIVAAVFILLLVIAVSTYRNMDRERVRMEETLLREGRIVLYSFAGALRTGFSSDPPDIRRMNRLLEDISRGPEIPGISLLDSEGNVVAYNSQGEKGGKVGGASLKLLLGEKGLVTRYGRDRFGERVFEIIQPLRPFFSSRPLLAVPGKGGEAEGKEEPFAGWSQDKSIVFSFRLHAFERARQEDIRHVILMGAILIILGTGALYFIFVVQNYYLVDRTLGQIRTYTENVVDSMADGLISLDENGRIMTMNRQAAEILAGEIESLKGKTIADVLGDRIDLLLRSAKGHIIRDREVELEGQNGGRTPLSISAAPLKDETGREMGQVLLIRDLREIRELKEKIRRSEHLASLGRVAAGMAHEIRNPLSSIRGFAQFFLNRFRGQKEEEEYAAVMVREVDRLNRVITELLDFARPRELRREPCSLEAVIDYALKVLAMKLAEKKVTVEKNYEKGLPPAPADQEQLSQAFLNLLLNALDAVEEGGEIMIGLTKDPRRSALNITLTDNGYGIPPGDMERIFEPFFSTKRKGTGLGLAIVHQIIVNHGGEITVENRPEGGTAFRIVLPIQNPGKIS